MSYAGCQPGFTDAVMKVAGVLEASCVSSMAVAQSHDGGTFSLSDGRAISIETTPIDYRYFTLFGVKPVAGRLLSPDHGEDDVLREREDVAANPSIVINESAVKVLGFGSPQNAVGQFTSWTRFELTGDRYQASPPMSSQVVGVVPDFSIGSIRDAIEPTAYFVNPARGWALVIKIDGNAIPETMRAVKELWASSGPPRPFGGKFLSQEINDLYIDILRQSQIFSAFAGVAVAVAALGLLGLAIFVAERRTKEIGLRKVMGADRVDILKYIGWHFAKPVLWGNVIAWPVGYLIMQRWLEGFAYHVALSPWMFLAASGLAVVIAILTVIGHTLLVARAQPVTALRYE
jgi:putative ABC transport system permease protein